MRETVHGSLPLPFPFRPSLALLPSLNIPHFSPFDSALIPVNAPQAKLLATLAKSKNLFLLEAVWTRFFPLSTQIRQLISVGTIGSVSLVFADFGAPQDKRKLGLQHRIYNPDLAGGSLLDMGLYSLTWVMQCVYHAQRGRSERPTVEGSLCLDEDTGVDEIATVVLSWKDGMSPSENYNEILEIWVSNLVFAISLGADVFVATGIATSNIVVPTDGNGTGSAGPAVKIIGSKATITVPWPIYRPTEYTIHWHEQGKEPERHIVPIPGKGMHWQADATARGIRTSS